jgi:hypothetical protein
MDNWDRGEASAAVRPLLVEPSSDRAEEPTLDQHIEEVLDYHLSGGPPVPPAGTFTCGSGQTVAAGNLMPRLRCPYIATSPADQPDLKPRAICPAERLRSNLAADETPALKSSTND